MKIIKILSFLILVAFGIFMVVFGERDDSPGAQMLGLLAVIGGSVGAWKSKKKKENIPG